MMSEPGVETTVEAEKSKRPSSRSDTLFLIVLTGFLALGFMSAVSTSGKFTADLIWRWWHPTDAVAENDASRKSWIKYCNDLVTEGIEYQTRWNDVFGCLAKRGEEWDRVMGNYYQPRVEGVIAARNSR